jgi:ribonuclease Z
MSLSFQVLGRPGRDNALLVLIDAGQAVHRLLFDCGDGCVLELPFAEVQAVDHLFFSHLHMDHVGGFDAFFRCTFNRAAKPNHVWGPPRTAEVLHHRFQGFLWNLHEGAAASWHVHDVHPGRVATRRFELAEAFAAAHDGGVRTYDRIVLDAADCTVEALLMDHGTPSAAYVVREAARVNVDAAKLTALGLRPGPWLKRVRGPRAAAGETVLVEGAERSVAELQDALVTTTPGGSLAYLTDFRLDAAAEERLAAALAGVGAVVCESQYREADQDLADRNYHMTAARAAAVARRAGVGRLVLFHLSDRYRPPEWRDMLAEAQAVFPRTEFPEGW